MSWNPNASRRQRGLTLVEMLVALSISAFLGIVLYTVFAQGCRVWQRANRERPQIDLDIALEKITADLRNVVTWSKSVKGLKGDKKSVEFYTRMPSSPGKPELETAELRMKPGRVRYLWNAGAKTLVRSAEGYGQLLGSQRDKLREQVLLRGVESFKLDYFSPGKEKGLWVKDWGEEGMPAAVKVTVEFENRRGKPLSKIVGLPGMACAN